MKFCVFVERTFDNECFEQLKNLIKKNGANNVRLYCMTPANYELIKSEQGYTGTKEELSALMAERYKVLQEIGCKINLHLHLSLCPEKLALGYEENLFKEAVQWLDDNGFDPKEWIAGWYSYTKRSLLLGTSNGLKYNKNKGHYNIHDYQLGNIFSIMNIAANIRNLFR